MVGGSSTSLSEQSPPLPVAKFQVRLAISLDNTDCIQLMTAPVEMPEYAKHHT